ncbi:MAG: CapA family protein [Clostridia bacterium]|nr:CapA family protein [Clostridia bacterium]
MPPRKHERVRRRKRRVKLALLLLNVALAIAIVVVGVMLAVQGVGNAIGIGKPTTTTTAAPREPKVVSTATVGNSGDILIHTPVLRSAKVSSGVYDFEPMFQYLKPYVSALDYSAINLEFGIGKGESDYYQAEMYFRVPPSLIDTVTGTGYDLGLCANNHVTNGSSLSLTANTYVERNLDFIGLRASSADKRYLVKDVNGIKLGFVNYTYGAQTGTTGMVNYFSTKALDAFYADMQQQMENMKSEGAEAIIVYLHWGNEYETKPNAYQTQMANKLCEMGVDVIVGGHPHKIQPLELITAENGNQTVCLYSMGNILSNQTIESMYGGSSKTSSGSDWQLGGQCQYRDVKSRYKDTHYGEHHYDCNDNGHTEDGLVFEYTFSKYEDGTVILTGVDVLPTWCYMTGSGNSRKYTIVPLDKSCESEWQTKFGVAEVDMLYAQRSYERTMALVGEGITAINAKCKQDVDAFVEDFKQAQLPTTQSGTTTTAKE